MQIINRMVSEQPPRAEAQHVRLIAERSLFLKRRWRGMAEDGTEFGFDLESRLRHGGVFYQTEQVDYIICQQPEPVYQISLRDDPAFAALAGWKIGNLHFPVQITEGWLRTLPDPAISQLFKREGWVFEEVTVVFNPLRTVPHAS